jgi:hypothetical protein
MGDCRERVCFRLDSRDRSYAGERARKVTRSASVDESSTSCAGVRGVQRCRRARLRTWRRLWGRQLPRRPERRGGRARGRALGNSGLFGELESFFRDGRLRKVGLESGNLLAVYIDLFSQFVHLGFQRSDAFTQLLLLPHGILNQIGDMDDLERLECAPDDADDEVRMLIDRQRSQQTNDVADSMPGSTPSA